MSADMLDGLWVILTISIACAILAPVFQWLLLPRTQNVAQGKDSLRCSTNITSGHQGRIISIVG